MYKDNLKIVENSSPVNTLLSTKAIAMGFVCCTEINNAWND